MSDYLKRTGRIFDIQKFSVHDGPGVRTIVFLKGCFMRCKWCCNPESQNYNIETMNGKTVGRDVTVEEVMAEVSKDRVYYGYSGGGLTLSGGECMFQPEFAEGLLRAAHDMGFNTAIETTSNAPTETVRRLLPHIDHYLMDIKHIDSDKHRAFTGSGNEQILKNAQIVAKEAKHMVVRVPVIPTFNDTPEEIDAISRFTAQILPHGEINLLPYHRLGLDKYKNLGRDYSLTKITPPTDETMTRLLEIPKKYGLKAKLGG